MNKSQERLLLTVGGQVQGVGFRPYVWRLARELKISGHIANTSAGVIMDIQGSPEILRIFKARLVAELPPLAKISAIREKILPPEGRPDKFEIIRSSGHKGQNVLLPPDMAICQDCLKDIRDPANPRYGYAFTNCTNCGPRFTITRAIPYDRPATVMNCFEMCATCRKEYTNPADRRFHAQPIACPVCGPKLWLVTTDMLKCGKTAPTQANNQEAIAETGRLIQNGAIVAIRGLGGFQLACDARNSHSVELLRKRKNRPHKALAVMAANVQSIENFCALSAPLIHILESPAAPITLCPKSRKPILPLSPAIAPDVNDIGIMLPYTPLHALLLQWLQDNGTKEPVLVMTSANPANEPICLGNREALTRLPGLADAWLLHNRDILCRVDDSVTAIGCKGQLVFRRSRGYVPNPLPLPEEAQSVLGAGADLKATFCLTRKKEAFLSQHIGDLGLPATLEFYEQALAHMQNLLETSPKTVIHDLHPDFISTSFAREISKELGIQAIGLQHHLAHAAACVAENGITEECIALCLDGSGLGLDGTVWGGEILRINLSKPAWARLGHFTLFPLPGGDAAVREPWRIRLALQWQTGELPANLDTSAKNLLTMLERNINCPQTSSCGRLFDAVSALCGLCEAITYEGQAAMRLESHASQWLAENPLPRISDIFISDENIDSQKLFQACQKYCKTHTPGATAAWFHATLAQSLGILASRYCEKYGLRHVALTGGVMQNRLLEKLLAGELENRGLVAITHGLTPPGDGSIAYGQAVWGAALLSGQHVSSQTHNSQIR